jgi:predicted dehydrogenase
MNLPAQVGIVGCGVISSHYVEKSAMFDSFEIVACADLDPERATALADEHGLRPASVDEVIDDPAIDVILNLTPPVAHAQVTEQALTAGKHVYTEKPLAMTPEEGKRVLELAERSALRVGCAPDTFLSAPYQGARRLIDDGVIGDPLAVSASLLLGGAEFWHPNPEPFYADGAGPLLDMGPYYLTAIIALLGPIRTVTGFSSTRYAERTVTVGPRAGNRFPVTTPTHIAGALALESGVTVGLIASFDAREQYICDFTIYGSEAALALPDPNDFVGPLRVRRGQGEWEDVPFTPRAFGEGRGIGLDDMVEAVQTGDPHRASGELGLHVLEVARAVLEAAAASSFRVVRSRVDRPAPRRR